MLPYSLLEIAHVKASDLPWSAFDGAVEEAIMSISGFTDLRAGLLVSILWSSSTISGASDHRSGGATDFSVFHSDSILL